MSRKEESRQTGADVHSGADEFGLTHAELAEEFRSLVKSGGLDQEPLDSELWPTEGLSDEQIRLLTPRLKRAFKKR